MMEIAAINSIISGIKVTKDLTKLIKESSNSLENAEINLKLAELIETLADAKVEIANVREVILEKDEEIRQLKELINTKKNIVWKDPYYFMVENDKQDGPFCQKCYDSEQKLIRLQSPGKNGVWKCNECSSDYKDSNYKPTAGIFVGKSRSSIFDNY